MGNFDVFDVFQLDHQNLTRQIIQKQYRVYRCMVKDGPAIKIFSTKYLKSQYTSKFPTIKILRYTVLSLSQLFSPFTQNVIGVL